MSAEEWAKIGGVKFTTGRSYVTVDASDDELEAALTAARAMLAALEDCLATTRLLEEDPAARLDHIMGVAEEAIAQAKAAGITT